MNDDDLPAGYYRCKCGYTDSNRQTFNAHDCVPPTPKEQGMELLKECTDMIKDIYLNELVKECLDKAPAYFWTSPSSTTGKYHLQDEFTVGGLVIHTYRTCKVASHLVRAYDMIPQHDKDQIYAACLLHDIIKFGFEGRELRDAKGNLQTDPLHPLYVRKHIEKCGGFNTDMFIPAESRIVELVESHMGKWSPIELLWDDDNFKEYEGIVHLSDFIASRREFSSLFGWIKFRNYGPFEQYPPTELNPDGIPPSSCDPSNTSCIHSRDNGEWKNGKRDPAPTKWWCDRIKKGEDCFFQNIR